MLIRSEKMLPKP